MTFTTHNTVKKLVLPLAGLGKRLRPLTLVTPKNLVELCGKPILEYTLEDAALSGVNDIILVISPDHRVQFDKYLEIARKQFPKLAIHVRFQEIPLGNGHAILQAADLVGEAPFLVRFCDDVIISDKPILKTLAGFFGKYGSPTMLLERVAPEFVSRYGVVATEDLGHEPFLCKIKDVVEKPQKEEAPSNLIIVGGYVLTAGIVRHLKNLKQTKEFTTKNELWLTEAFQLELEAGGKIYGWEFQGKRLDCGTLEGLREAGEYLRRNRD